MSSDAEEAVSTQAAQDFIRKRYTRASIGYRTLYEMTGRADAVFNAASAEDRAGHRAEAASCYATYLRTAPSGGAARDHAMTRLGVLDPAQLARTAEALYDAGRPSDARAVWAAFSSLPQRIGTAQPGPARRAAADMKLARGQAAEAAAAYEALYAADQDPVLLVVLGQARERAGDPLSARAAYAAAAADPRCPARERGEAMARVGAIRAA